MQLLKNPIFPVKNSREIFKIEDFVEKEILPNIRSANN
jgi:hypothetical protein